MAAKKSKPAPYVKCHHDGTVLAKGQMADGVPVGYWEWFRRNGTIKRSGHFDADGKSTGEWRTYDAQGAVIVQKFILTTPNQK